MYITGSTAHTGGAGALPAVCVRGELASAAAGCAGMVVKPGKKSKLGSGGGGGGDDDQDYVPVHLLAQAAPARRPHRSPPRRIALAQKGGGARFS